MKRQQRNGLGNNWPNDMDNKGVEKMAEWNEIQAVTNKGVVIQSESCRIENEEQIILKFKEKWKGHKKVSVRNENEYLKILPARTFTKLELSLHLTTNVEY